jgi:hypothetical protein
MKKLFIFTVLIVFLANAASNAQEDRKIRFGLNAAPSIAWLKAQEKSVKGDGLSLRFKYGLVFDYKFADNFWFGTGLDITYLGGSLNYQYPAFIKEDEVSSTNNSNYIKVNSASYTAQYLELPLTVKMKTNEINNMVYFAQVGLNNGFRLDAKTKFGSFNKVKTLNDAALIRIAINISGGVEYNLTGTTSLLLGITYNNGFTNLLSGSSDFVKIDLKNNGALTDLNTNVRSNYIGLNIGFLF